MQNKIITKLIIIVLFIFGFAFLNGQSVFARSLQDATGGLGTVAEGAGVSDKVEVEEVVSNVIKTGLNIIGLLFFGLMFYGGFNWMSARGNESQIEKSKNTIIAAVIGLVVVLAAYAITALVGTFVGGA